MGGNNSKKNFNYLRLKAEELLIDKDRDQEKLSLEIDEIIHELEIHQIELKIQNEDLIKTQLDLENSRQDYYELYDFAPVGYITLDDKEIITRVNLTGAEMLGKPRKYLINEALIRFIDPSYKKRFYGHIQEVKKANIKQKCQVELISSEKKFLFVNLDTITSLDEERNLKGFKIILTDISEIKKIESDLEDSLKEKDLLIKETHHRVKNNLQVISSLLNLQSDYIKDKTEKEFFRESQNRAKAMALIHELLYQSTNMGRIDFAEYVKTLVYDIYKSYKSNFEFIKLILELKPITLDINTAIPCGLVINELVSNVMKHAFTPGEKGDLNINLSSYNENLVLIIKDNGIGFPSSIDFKNTETLGLKLVNTLVDQINGKIEITADNGTEIRITFPEVKFDNK
jgi:two-component sensor histidine kinase